METFVGMKNGGFFWEIEDETNYKEANMPNELQTIEQETNNIEVQAKGYNIISQKTYELTADFLRGVKSLKKKVDDAFDDDISKSNLLHKSLVATKKRYYQPLLNAEQTIKDKVKSYERQKEQERLDAEAKAREEAKKKEEEAQAQLKKDAEKAALTGDVEKTEQLLQEAESVLVEPDIVASTIDREKGLGTVRINWYFRIVDESKIPLEYLCPDEKKIGKVVRALKKDTSIPGIEIYHD